MLGDEAIATIIIILYGLESHFGGADSRQYLRRNPLPEIEVLGLFLHVSEAAFIASVIESLDVMPFHLETTYGVSPSERKPSSPDTDVVWPPRAKSLIAKFCCQLLTRNCQVWLTGKVQS